MTEEILPGEEPGVAGGDRGPHRKTSPVASLAQVSAEPKGYPDVAERDSGARQEESISGEEEDFLSE
jgi:hypothetical protein